MLYYYYKLIENKLLWIFLENRRYFDSGVAKSYSIANNCAVESEIIFSVDVPR